MIETAFSRESFMVMGKLQIYLIQRVIKKNKKSPNQMNDLDCDYKMGCKILFPHLIFTRESSKLFYSNGNKSRTVPI